MNSDNKRRTLDNVIRFTTIIGAGSHFHGDFHGDDNYVVNGNVSGECDINGTLVVMESGKFQGNIRSNVAVIAGIVLGDLHIKDKLELRSSGRVTGNIYCNSIAMAEGAIHEGQIHMDADAVVTQFNERRHQGEGVPSTS